ncbi:hypothetical protein JVT61DRAFT_4796 [Boletus reticuloceps]|uniref:Uncharacterized protein n=1 Tax=Boletus reticuloceps TaxID=495285 RepID=A0A8I3A8N4_9AGAM|nr:hypothetical protein JVT61DRAFT_4796 [Boletus reticuloceps]
MTQMRLACGNHFPSQPFTGSYAWFPIIAIPPIMPRLIISIRELYDRDLRGYCRGIDSGFGVFSQTGASDNPDVSAISFAEVNPRHEEGQVVASGEDLGAIRLEVLGDGPCQV